MKDTQLDRLSLTLSTPEIETGVHSGKLSALPFMMFAEDAHKMASGLATVAQLLKANLYAKERAEADEGIPLFPPYEEETLLRLLEAGLSSLAVDAGECFKHAEDRLEDLRDRQEAEREATK